MFKGNLLRAADCPVAYLAGTNQLLHLHSLYSVTINEMRELCVPKQQIYLRHHVALWQIHIKVSPEVDQNDVVTQVGSIPRKHISHDG